MGSIGTSIKIEEGHGSGSELHIGGKRVPMKYDGSHYIVDLAFIKFGPNVRRVSIDDLRTDHRTGEKDIPNIKETPEDQPKSILKEKHDENTAELTKNDSSMEEIDEELEIAKARRVKFDDDKDTIEKKDKDTLVKKPNNYSRIRIVLRNG